MYNDRYTRIINQYLMTVNRLRCECYIGDTCEYPTGAVRVQVYVCGAVLACLEICGADRVRVTRIGCGAGAGQHS